MFPVLLACEWNSFASLSNSSLWGTWLLYFLEFLAPSAIERAACHRVVPRQWVNGTMPVPVAGTEAAIRGGRMGQESLPRG